MIMAAYFIEYTYASPRAKDIRYRGNCIIDYERFETVNHESFFRKFKEKVSCCYEPKIEKITKL